jgi:hypothetical protein
MSIVKYRKAAAGPRVVWLRRGQQHRSSQCIIRATARPPATDLDHNNPVRKDIEKLRVFMRSAAVWAVQHACTHNREFHLHGQVKTLEALSTALKNEHAVYAESMLTTDADCQDFDDPFYIFSCLRLVALSVFRCAP